MDEELQSQSFVMVVTFLRTISVMPRFCFARHVVRKINILEQNALTMKCLQSFWNARAHPGSVIRNVKPFNFINYIVNQVQYESVL